MNYYLTGLKGNTIIAIVDLGILDPHIVASVNVPSIGIGDEIGAGRHGADVDVIVKNIFAFIDLLKVRTK
jgi:hypothetical protein